MEKCRKRSFAVGFQHHSAVIDKGTFGDSGIAVVIGEFYRKRRAGYLAAVNVGDISFFVNAFVMSVLAVIPEGGIFWDAEFSGFAVDEMFAAVVDVISESKTVVVASGLKGVLLVFLFYGYLDVVVMVSDGRFYTQPWV